MSDNGSNERKNLKFTDIETLSDNLDADYNEMLNAELCFTRYSMNHILKDYAGLSNDYKIHALLEHGVIINEYVGGAFRAHEYLPSIVSSKYRVGVLEKQSNFHGAYAIGPYIHYANSIMDKEQIKEEKERLGKSLLVFPSHSIEGSISKFDFEGFIDQIKTFAGDFDTVRVCLYYKDIQLKRHEFYQKNGFEVVTAGHLNDYYFLPRLKNIIELSDMTMSNNVSTHLGYCIYLNKPHFVLDNDIKYVAEGKDRNSQLMIDNGEKALSDVNNNDNFLKIKQLFSNFDEKITKDQYDLIGYLWGFDEIKSPGELKKLFFNINENYSMLKYYFSGLIRLKDIILHGR